jgi:hypothetical protein
MIAAKESRAAREDGRRQSDRFGFAPGGGVLIGVFR